MLGLHGGTPVRARCFPAWPVHGDEEARALLDVLHSTQWGGYSPKVRECEEAFARSQGAAHAISCANGTVALEAVLRAVGLTCGDEVIVPPFTFAATATAVGLCQGYPVFADIDPRTLNLAPQAVEAAITPRTRAIIVVHFGGHPADMDAFTALAERRGLALIEDAAHAHGARWRGAPVGTFGVAGTFSFQSFKLLTAGEGGMIVTRSTAMADALWAYCNQGRRKNGGWYEHFTLGTNGRMTGFQAAVLLEQLRRLPEQSRRRHDNVCYLRRQLQSVPGVSLPEDDARVEAHPHYIVTLRYDKSQFADVERDLLVSALQAEGIPAQRTYPYPLYRNPVFQPRLAQFGRVPSCPCPQTQNYASLCLPESERACRDGIWLEHQVFLGDHRDMDDIVAAFQKIQRSSGVLARASGSAPIA